MASRLIVAKAAGKRQSPPGPARGEFAHLVVDVGESAAASLRDFSIRLDAPAASGSPFPVFHRRAVAIHTPLQ